MKLIKVGQGDVTEGERERTTAHVKRESETTVGDSAFRDRTIEG